MDGGTTFTQIKATPQSANDPDRAGASPSRSCPNGKTRMYSGRGRRRDTARASTARDDATAAARSSLDLTTAQNIDYCTGQCWYDNVVYTPAGFPDVVYLLGSFDYGQLGGVSNGRAVLLSTDAGVDLERPDAGWRPHARRVHASRSARDRHVARQPVHVLEGSDGGIVSSDGKFCRRLRQVRHARAERGRHRPLQEPAVARAERAGEQHQPRLLDAAVPESVGEPAASRTTCPGRHAGQRHLPERRARDEPTWPQIIYGDGGQSGFSSDQRRRCASTRSPARRTTRTSADGDPTKWVIISAPIIISPEASLLLSAGHRRPAPGERRHDLPGLLQRLADAGLGRRSGVTSKPTAPSSRRRPPARLRRLRDHRPGAPTTDLTDTVAVNYGSGSPRQRAGRGLRRTASNSGTLWAATGTGRVFVSDNADAARRFRRRGSGRSRIRRI